MDDSSKSSGSSSLDSDSAASSYKHNQLPPRKRHKSFTVKKDHGVITSDQSTPPRKRRLQLKIIDDNTASRTISSWRKLHEIDLLKNILDYYNKNGTYPFDDPAHMQNFYKGWIQQRGVYVDEDVFNSKMVELPERFFKNQENIYNNVRGKIQDWMDPSDVEIYRLSSMIWGNDDDDFDDFDDDDNGGDVDMIDEPNDLSSEANGSGTSSS